MTLEYSISRIYANTQFGPACLCGPITSVPTRMPGSKLAAPYIADSLGWVVIHGRGFQPLYPVDDRAGLGGDVCGPRAGVRRHVAEGMADAGGEGGGCHSGG